MIEHDNESAFDPDEKEYDAEPEIIEPYNPDKVDIIPVSMPIALLLTRIKNKEMDMNPDFQRNRGLWDKTKKSRLIESILIKVPLPVFYFDSRDDERWTIVDGLQRIHTLNEFVLEKKFRLCGLEYLKELEDCDYDDLNRTMQRRIQESQIQLYCIRKGTPDNIAISIFKRINTGGVTLNLAEIRNCVFHGIAADLVKEMARLESFKIATRNRISSERMDDRDLATRFLAFYILNYQNYNGNMDSFLEEGLSKVKNSYSKEQAKKLLDTFDKSMICCRKVFGDYAFRKRVRKENTTKYGPLNKSLFECVSTSIGMLSIEEQNKLIDNKDDFFNSYNLLFNQSFYSSINSATGSKEHVLTRYQEFNNLVRTKLRSYK